MYVGKSWTVLSCKTEYFTVAVDAKYKLGFHSLWETDHVVAAAETGGHVSVARGRAVEFQLEASAVVAAPVGDHHGTGALVDAARRVAVAALRPAAVVVDAAERRRIGSSRRGANTQDGRRLAHPKRLAFHHKGRPGSEMFHNQEKKGIVVFLARASYGTRQRTAITLFRRFLRRSCDTKRHRKTRQVLLSFQKLEKKNKGR